MSNYITQLVESLSGLSTNEKRDLSRLFQTEATKVANLIEFPDQSKDHYKEWMELDAVYERAKKAQEKYKTAVRLGLNILDTLIKAALV